MNISGKKKYNFNFNFRLPNYNPYYSSLNSNVGYGSNFIDEGSWKPTNFKEDNFSRFSNKKKW